MYFNNRNVLKYFFCYIKSLIIFCLYTFIKYCLDIYWYNISVRNTWFSIFVIEK